MTHSTQRGATRAGTARSYVIAGLFLLLAGVAARVSSAFIELRFPDRPTPRDLFFELVPQMEWMQYTADIVLVVGVLLVAAYVIKASPKDGPALIALIGILQTVRAAVNVLTPLASPLGNGLYWGVARYVQNGMFPSGHTGTALLLYLIVDGRKAPWLKRVMLLLFGTECFALIAGRGHYSIDVVGGFLLAYVLYEAWDSGRGLGWLKRMVKP